MRAEAAASVGGKPRVEREAKAPPGALVPSVPSVEVVNDAVSAGNRGGTSALAHSLLKQLEKCGARRNAVQRRDNIGYGKFD